VKGGSEWGGREGVEFNPAEDGGVHPQLEEEGSHPSCFIVLGGHLPEGARVEVGMRGDRDTSTASSRGVDAITWERGTRGCTEESRRGRLKKGNAGGNFSYERTSVSDREETNSMQRGTSKKQCSRRSRG